MVQVDVFWSYAIGSGLAVAASHQLRARQAAPAQQRTPLAETPWFTRSLLFLALLFAPSGLYLLWEFASWETMHAGDRSLPALLVVTFAITNVTQGVLGFWVVERLLARGRDYLAWLQPLAGYFAMFFVLVHGWDGRGYQRFFSATKADFLAWNGDWAAWLGSNVAVTLYVMGAILLPVMFWLMVRWQSEGYALVGVVEAGRTTPGPTTIVGLALLTAFGLGLGGAIAASLLVHALGWPLGLLAFAAFAWALALRRGGLAWRLFELNALADAAATAPASRPLRRGTPSTPANPLR